ncbi:hypothetical protein ACGF13_21085 [Kitasatospora sp. NPDC048286]|uniref:hypothetical protein n=1 Tax=Kitasatospora sp. NPDC048286 TaxID=3364047 RepID=UPI003710CDC5
MAQRLTEFVLKLAEDPAAVRRFEKYPAEMMAEAGLSQEEKDVLTSNDPLRVRSLIAAETGEGPVLASTTLVMTLVWVIHHPH